MLKFIGSSNIKNFMKHYLESEGEWFRDKDVIDIPAGSGYTSSIVASLGGKVRAYDLFPQFFTAEGLNCEEADLAEQLPIEDESADMLICQEGIEHLQDQLAVLKEFNRVLKLAAPRCKSLLKAPVFLSKWKRNERLCKCSKVRIVKRRIAR